MRAAPSLVLLVAAAIAAGCLSPLQTDTPPTDSEAPLLTMDLPVHVVAVGFDGFDAAALEKHLVQPPPVFELIRAFTTAHMEYEPLQYNVQYMVHEAPEGFARELFAFMPQVAEKGPPHAWLANWDRAGEQRVCPASSYPAGAPPPPSQPFVVPPEPVSPPPCEDIDRIDAQAVEAWIADNRARFGLDFGGASQTLFVLDTYTAGLPTDTYHVYRLKDGVGLANQNMRAWGGAHDFLFLDVGAAPHSSDYNPWWRSLPQDVEWANEEDGPIWMYQDDMASFYENLGRNVADAVQFVWARDPIYPFEYSTKYVLPTYVIVDTTSQMNPGHPLASLSAADIKQRTDEAAITQAFRDLVPWAQVDMPFTYIMLPDDDPALARAVEDSKSRSSGDRIDFGILKTYFRDNWDQYVPEVPGARVYPTFAFWFGEPSIGGGAFSDGDEWGRSFGVFFDIADNTRFCVRNDVPLCRVGEPQTADDWWPWWSYVFVHELGHSFGLMHPHDTGAITDGQPDVTLNWLWDSTSTPMTYRHTLMSFNTLDRELVLRHNAVHLARDALGSPGASDEAVDRANDALRLVQAGDYAQALDAAVAARRLSGWLPPEPLVSGEASKVEVSLPLSGSPVGRAPRAPPVFLGPAEMLGMSQAVVPFEVPADAEAVLLEFREQDAPTHRGWAGYLELLDSQGRWVTGAYGNGHDKVVLEDLARCDDGCELSMWTYSGTGNAYDVTVTPLLQP